MLDTRGGRFVAASLSGVLQYFATGLEPWWWAAWLAPIPLLLAAFRASRREAWALAIVAGLIGSASTAGYYGLFIGPIGSGVVMLLRGLISGLVVTRTRAVVVGSRHWLMVFVYPALLAAFDTIVAAVSRDGTIASLAYSQMTALPVIQIAALAGTPGIVFVVTLFGALVAIAWHRRSDIDKSWLAYGLPSVLIVVAVAYGFVRLAHTATPSATPVGLVAIDRDASATTNSVGADDPVWAAYAAAVPSLAQHGAKVVVLPEKIAPLDRAAAERVRARLGRVASDNAVYLLAGVTLLESGHQENRAWLFAPTGELIADYAKHHLIPGLEASFTPGSEFVVRSVGTNALGLAICKDMDFPALGRRYAALGVDALLVPAWDFDRDAWMHARMAVLRGVESGFAVVRSARQGLLTVSDRHGRIVAVTASGSAPVASLTVHAGFGAGTPTVYARLGDVFGWFCVIASVAALLASLRGRRFRRGKTVTIERVRDLQPESLAALIAESEQHGLRFVRRLADEWAAGVNRFDRAGEALFAARAGEQLVGVGGLNIDPYAATGNVGRVRHLYVLAAHRRRGIGERITAEIIAAARGRFENLRLRTSNPAAARLYERLGFRRTDDADCTHVMRIDAQVAVPPHI